MPTWDSAPASFCRSASAPRSTGHRPRPPRLSIAISSPACLPCPASWAWPRPTADLFRATIPPAIAPWKATGPGRMKRPTRDASPSVPRISPRWPSRCAPAVNSPTATTPRRPRRLSSTRHSSNVISATRTPSVAACNSAPPRRPNWIAKSSAWWPTAATMSAIPAGKPSTRLMPIRNATPIGRRLQFGATTPPKLDREIVGVVADSRDDVRDPGRETIYSPYAQWDNPSRMVFYVRTAGDPGRNIGALRQAVREADPNLPAVKIKTVEVRIRESLYTERLIAILSAAFGILATLLAAIGLYGVIAYSVARRTGEIGVRMALGAVPADVLRLVLFGAVRLAAAGIVIGLVAALAAGRLIESQLFGIKIGRASCRDTGSITAV